MHFKNTSPCGLLISVYLVVKMFSEFPHCHDICEHLESDEYKEVIFENDSSKHVSSQSASNAHTQ